MIGKTLFVASDSDSPRQIHETLLDAKFAEHDYIDVFDADGRHVYSLKRLGNGTYTNNF